MTYRIRYWTGPTRVAHYGVAARSKFGGDVLEGTEHVYFTVTARDETDAIKLVWDALGKSFTRASVL